MTIEHFADRLTQACREKGAPICVGLDPVFERLPAAIRGKRSARNMSAAVEAIRIFCSEVLKTVAPHVPCVKIQSACFERYLWHGAEAYHHLIHEARSLGLLVIADAKRGDIGISSAHYAAGCLSDPDFEGLDELAGPDALTVNSYLGADGLEPFVQLAAEQGKGLFALVRTSNPGGDAIQGLELNDGRRVADAVAQIVADVGDAPAYVGHSGYSLLGAVVGATQPQDAQVLRKVMPRQIFLVPGFGAQGGSVEDVRACFNADGTGAIITASRSVLYAYQKTNDADWQGSVERAAIELKQQVSAILG